MVEYFTFLRLFYKIQRFNNGFKKAVVPLFKAFTEDLFSRNASLQVVFAIKSIVTPSNFVELILFPHEF